MVLAVTHLTDGASTTDGTVFTTAAVTPVAGSLTLVFLVSTQTANPALPTSVVGNGVTYTQVATVVAEPTRESLYASLDAAGAGVITLTWGTTQTGVIWSVDRVTGQDTRSVGHALGAVTRGTQTATSSSAAYATPVPPTWAGYNGLGLNTLSVAEVLTQVGGFSALARQGHSTPTVSMAVQWKAETLTTGGWTWTTNCITRALYVLIRPALSGADPAQRVVINRRRRAV